MQTLQKFTGINNAQQPEELGTSELTVATNVDIDLAGRAQRRAGLTSASATQHGNLWETPAFTLATRGAAGDLVNVTTNTVLAAALGHTPRLWFCDLPGGRVGYSNGTAMGIVSADGASVTPWGVPIPASLGAAADAIGNLFPGDYQYSLTYVRLADNMESGPAYSPGAVTIASGGLSLSALPVLAGHKINVYLTSHFGGERFFAGSTSNALFSFTGHNKDLVRRCLTEFLQPPPAGAILLGFWRGRMLAAVGNVLYASRSHSWHLFNLRLDFRQFGANITLVQPVDAGIWVGTEKELSFLSGQAFDQLVREVKVKGGVVRGSGCKVPGERITTGNGKAEGDCMVCIADGWLFAGTGEGNLVPMSVDRYRTSATEVVSTFRMAGQIPQYIAAVQ